MNCPKCNSPVSATLDKVFVHKDGRAFLAYKCRVCQSEIEGEETETRLCNRCAQIAFLLLVRRWDDIRREVWSCTVCQTKDYVTVPVAQRAPIDDPKLLLGPMTEADIHLGGEA